MQTDPNIIQFAKNSGIDEDKLMPVDGGNYLALVNERKETYTDATIIGVRLDDHRYVPLKNGWPSVKIK